MNQTFKLIFIEFFIAITIVIFLWDFILLLPLKIFITSIHESFHGIATLITGGSIHDLKLNFDSSGHLISSGGFFPLISIAGYLGTALVGSLMLRSSFFNYHSLILRIIVITNLLILLIYSSWLSIPFFIAIIIAFLLLYLSFKESISRHISIFFSMFLLASSFQDIKTYLIHSPTNTDAGILARYLGMEFLTIFIALAFTIITIFIYYLGIKFIIKSNRTIS